ncbi:15829_t:CDS:2, partial [Acaulospora colombiana]
MKSVYKLVSTVNQFYREINPSTLSGAIDVVVVQQPNGDLACSPFHVRFGKLSVLRPLEKKVEVTVNKQAVDVPMKIGEAGEAFFVFETENVVPEELQTSPLAGPSDPLPNVEEPDFLDLGASAGRTSSILNDDDFGMEDGYEGDIEQKVFEKSLKNSGSISDSINLTDPTSDDVAGGTEVQNAINEECLTVNDRDDKGVNVETLVQHKHQESTLEFHSTLSTLSCFASEVTSDNKFLTGQNSEGPFSDTELDETRKPEKPTERRTHRASPLSDTELEYEPKKPSKEGGEWSWGWGALPVRTSKKIEHWQEGTDELEWQNQENHSDDLSGIEIG